MDGGLPPAAGPLQSSSRQRAGGHGSPELGHPLSVTRSRSPAIGRPISVTRYRSPDIGQSICIEPIGQQRKHCQGILLPRRYGSIRRVTGACRKDANQCLALRPTFGESADGHAPKHARLGVVMSRVLLLIRLTREAPPLSATHSHDRPCRFECNSFALQCPDRLTPNAPIRSWQRRNSQGLVQSDIRTVSLSHQLNFLVGDNF